MPIDADNYNTQYTPHQPGTKEQPLPLIVLFDADLFTRTVSTQQLTKAGWVVLAVDTSKAEEIRCVADLLIEPLSDPAFANPHQQQEQQSTLFTMSTSHNQVSYVKLMAFVLEASHPLLPSATALFPSLPPTPVQQAIREKYPVPPPRPGYRPPASSQLYPAHTLAASDIVNGFVERGVSFGDIPTILYTDNGPGLAIARYHLAAFATGRSETTPIISTALERYVDINLEGVVFTTPISALAPVPGSTANPRPFQVLPVYLSLQPNSDDRLLAVMAHLTGYLMCRGCHRRFAPEEPAALLAYYQLWCQDCITLHLGQTYQLSSDPGGKLLAFPSLRADNTQLDGSPGPNNKAGSKTEGGSPTKSSKQPPIRLAQRREWSQTSRGYEQKLGQPPHFFPARLLAKAAFSRATGASPVQAVPANPNGSKRRRAKPHNASAWSQPFLPATSDPWNSA
jgi:hypothetical protein